MRVQTYLLTPKTAFGTPLAGDTLFGQSCWAIHHILGKPRLEELLQGYTSAAPFMVVSDALPAGYVPLPHVPGTVWEKDAGADLKTLKSRRWLPIGQATQPFVQWQRHARSAQEVERMQIVPQSHNTINRLTGTTGTGVFAPYSMTQRWYAPGTQLEVHVVYDSGQISVDELTQIFEYIGQVGFGRDASIGLGKFTVAPSPNDLGPLRAENANAFLCLGPCVPQGLDFDPQRSYWQVLTRFGRHGDVAVYASNLFKKPILMAQAGSVFWPNDGDCQKLYIGGGLGGIDAPISRALKETVHQGYCPVVPIELPSAAYETTEVLL